MMRRLVAILACGALCSPIVSWADDSDEALQWLERIATAAQELEYSGVFTYQSGREVETSRITRIVSDSGESERLEVLDGSPREVIRRDGEVLCVFPEQKTVIKDHSRSLQQRTFPARVPAQAYEGIPAHYELVKGGRGRVAGYEVQLIELRPRDSLRYAHQLWADVGSGLLLKARTIDNDGALIEQFSFRDVRIGEHVEPDGLEPRYLGEEGWNIVSAHGDEVDKADVGWRLTESLPGYELKSVLMRPLGRERQDVLHMVYSDGLASISVFIEAVDEELGAEGLGPLASGAINVYRRSEGMHLVTVLGEVPLEALQRLGDALERREDG